MLPCFLHHVKEVGFRMLFCCLEAFGELASVPEREEALARWARRLRQGLGPGRGQARGHGGRGNGRHGRGMPVNPPQEKEVYGDTGAGPDIHTDDADSPDEAADPEFEAWESDLLRKVPPVMCPEPPLVDPERHVVGPDSIAPSRELLQPPHPLSGPAPITPPAIDQLPAAPVPLVAMVGVEPGRAIAQRFTRAGEDGWPRYWRPSGASVRVSMNPDGSCDLRAMCSICGGSRSGTCKAAGTLLPDGAAVQPTLTRCQGQPVGKIFNFVLQGELLGPAHSRAARGGVPSGLPERTQARQVGLVAMSSAELWWPSYREGWPPLADLERPWHASLDNAEGEPLISR